MPTSAHSFRWWLRIATAALLGGAWSFAAAQATSEGPVTMQATLQPLPSDGLAALELRLRDTASGQPVELPPRRLAAWLQKIQPTLAEGELACRDKVRMLASQGLGRRAAVDFNIHRLMAVNTDNTLTFINPFLRLNQAKLEEVVTLPGTPTAVLVRAALHEVWLALPEVDQVVVIDTDARRVRRSYALASGARPVALVEAGGAVWVAQAGRDEWLRIAGAAHDAERISAPRVQGWLLPDQANQPLGLGASGIVRADGQQEASGRLLQGVWSALAQRGIAAHVDRDLLWLDAQGRVQQRLPTHSPVQRIALFDNGRYALAVTGAEALAVDVATAQVLQTVALAAPVSDIRFTGNFAYLHSAATSSATLLALADLRVGQAKPIQVAVGAPASDAIPSLAPASNAHRMQPLPDGAGMYVASPGDGQIYQYAEGMMAPIGSFSNYRRSALALVMLDDGLQSLGDGRYHAVLRAPRGGNYELVVSGVQPRFAQCMPLAIPDIGAHNVASTAAAEARVHARMVSVQPMGTGWLVRAALRQGEGAHAQPLAGVSDVQLLAFERKTGWQMRRPMRATADGMYEARLDNAPTAQTIDFLVGSASQNLPFHAGALGSHALGDTP